ncbi:TetR/AcrR family transcriptional regulator [Hymenobacter puniceus]|uniref:TetR/AcrR family transcriptional regulator n=1 Tax=Hymenobacter sp. BT190 TaxID=2763505 RepID=UPI0016512A81|nr:TetR/AcrR family transcriptional regulator [Hymenobacter sp. BT190]MBC6700124.1 TetR/AcrR family transcriptional regulator [Hymenobacter sp. BT190]
MPDQLDVRQRLVATASRLFYEQGYGLTGINQIIAEARIAKGSLYQHFASKDELCVEYLRTKNQQWFAALTAYLNATQTPRVLACFDFLVEHSVRDHFRGCSFLNILAEVPASQTTITAEARRHKQALRTLLRSLVAEVAQPAPDPEALGDTVYLLFEGAITESQVQQHVWPIQLAKQTVAKLLS